MPSPLKIFGFKSKRDLTTFSFCLIIVFLILSFLEIRAGRHQKPISVEFSFATVFAFKHHVSAAYVIVLLTIADKYESLCWGSHHGSDHRKKRIAKTSIGNILDRCNIRRTPVTVQFVASYGNASIKYLLLLLLIIRCSNICLNIVQNVT